MRHFLGKQVYGVPLESPTAMATVQVHSKKVLMVVADTRIGVSQVDTLFMDLPNDVVVMEPELPHRHIKPSNGKKFVITTQTFDPFHGLAEVKK